MPDIPPWLTALISILTPVSMAGWQIYLYRTGRYDKREDAREAAEDKQLQMLAGQRDKIIADQRIDLERCQALLVTTNADRYHGWDVARRWYDLAYTWRIQLMQALSAARAARQTAESMARLYSVEPPAWPGPLEDAPPLPPFDMPKG